MLVPSFSQPALVEKNQNWKRFQYEAAQQKKQRFFHLFGSAFNTLRFCIQLYMLMSLSRSRIMAIFIRLTTL